jgi:hypothetical protein
MAKRYAPVIPQRRASKYEPWERPKEAGKRYFPVTVGQRKPSRRFAPWIVSPYDRRQRFALGHPGTWVTPELSDQPGLHETWVGPTKVYYCVPHRIVGISRPRELLVAIHGAGDQHFQGALTNQADWGQEPIGEGQHAELSFANAFNAIVVAPAFERIYFPQAPEDTRTVEELADEWVKYFKAGSFPSGYVYPDAFLWDFVALLKKYSWYEPESPDHSYPAARCDHKLHEIFDVFRKFYPDLDQERFNIMGYSGGGQFVARYMTLYPDKLRRIALGGAGSFTFPFFNVNYPNGLRCRYGDLDYLKIWGHTYTDFWTISGLNNYFNRHGWGDWAHDLVFVSQDEWRVRLTTLLGRQVFVYAGGLDFVGEPSTWPTNPPPPSFWQGAGQLEKATNYIREMRTLYDELGRPAVAGKRSFEIYLNKGVEPSNLDHEAMRLAMVRWLRLHWWDYPRIG